MNLSRLQTLHAVVATGSVRAAAAHLGFTPSAVSQQVAKLEQEVGCPLLERVGRGVHPTAAGRLLSRHAELIDRRVSEAVVAMRDHKAGRMGTLRLQYFASIGSSLLADAVASFCAQNPVVRVELRLGESEDGVAAVDRGEVDLAVVVGMGPTTGGSRVEIIPLFDDPYDAVLPLSNPLSALDAVTVADLAEEPLVDATRQGPCHVPITDAFARSGCVPNFVAEAGDYATAQALVAAGLGVAIIPRSGLATNERDVAVRTLKPTPVRAIAAVTLKNDHRIPVASMLEALRQSQP